MKHFNSWGTSGRTTPKAGRSKTSKIVKCTACVGTVGALSMFTPAAFASTSSGTTTTAETNTVAAAKATATTFIEDDCGYELAPNKGVTAGTYGIGAKPIDDFWYGEFSTAEALCYADQYVGPLSNAKQLVTAENDLFDAAYLQDWDDYGYLPAPTALGAIQNDLQTASSDLTALLANQSSSGENSNLFDANAWIAYGAGWTTYNYIENTEYWYGDTNTYAVFALDLVRNDESSGGTAYDESNYALVTTDYLAYLWAAYELAPPEFGG